MTDSNFFSETTAAILIMTSKHNQEGIEISAGIRADGHAFTGKRTYNKAFTSLLCGSKNCACDVVATNPASGTTYNHNLPKVTGEPFLIELY